MCPLYRRSACWWTGKSRRLHKTAAALCGAVKVEVEKHFYLLNEKGVPPLAATALLWCAWDVNKGRAFDFNQFSRNVNGLWEMLLAICRRKLCTVLDNFWSLILHPVLIELALLKAFAGFVNPSLVCHSVEGDKVAIFWLLSCWKPGLLLCFQASSSWKD